MPDPTHVALLVKVSLTMLGVCFHSRSSPIYNALEDSGTVGNNLMPLQLWAIFLTYHFNGGCYPRGSNLTNHLQDVVCIEEGCRFFDIFIRKIQVPLGAVLFQYIAIQ